MNERDDAQYDLTRESEEMGVMRRIREGAGAVALVFGLLAWTDYLAFWSVSIAIGGSYHYGEVKNGEYFLGRGGNRTRLPLKRVSKYVYYYSVCHYWSIGALACVAGSACLIWVITGGRHGDQQRFDVRITPSGCTLNGEALEVDLLVEVLRYAQTTNPDAVINVKNEYEAQKAPPHAIAFQLGLSESGLLLMQEGPWR